MDLKLDCRYFRGDKPCQFRNVCRDCKHYRTTGIKILIIKLESIGDVLRTTPLLSGLKRKYPNSFISWVVDSSGTSILEGNPYIDRLLIFSHSTILRLTAEKFDMVISLDKVAEAAALASLCEAKEKLGYGLNKEGKIYPINPEAEYSFILGISDHLKFHVNKKTYQEMIFELTGIPYEHEEYILNLSDGNLKYAQDFFIQNGISKNDIVVGLNTGCGPVFPNKKWTIKGFALLADRIINEIGAKVVILGGSLEKERNKEIKRMIKGKIVDIGCENSMERFAAFLNLCNLLVTGDTLAMHLAIGLKRPVLAIFGPTCAQEIDLYGRGEKIITKINCAPCYKNSCDMMPNCMDTVTVDEVFNNILKLKKSLGLE